MKRLEAECPPYEWMKKDLGLAGAELVLFTAICENRCGLLDGVVDAVVVAKILGMGKSTYYLSRDMLLKRGLIRLVKRPGGSMIRLTDKSLEYVEKDARLASVGPSASSASAAAGISSSSLIEELTGKGNVEAVLISLSAFLKTSLACVNDLLAAVASAEARKKTGKASKQKTAKPEQLNLFD